MRVLFVIAFAAGPLLALAGPLLVGAGVRARRVHAATVAGTLLLCTGLAALLLPRLTADHGGLARWDLVAITAPGCIALLIAVAVRDERRRDGPRFVPAAVLAGFPAAVFSGAMIVVAAGAASG